MTRVARLAVAFAALSCFLAGAILMPTGARSAGYEVWSCTTDLNEIALVGSGWWMQGYGPYMNHCPDGLQFDSGDDVMLGSYGYSEDWEWSAYSGSKISRVTLTMKGGNTTGGLAYSLWTGTSGEKIADLPSRLPGAADATVSVNIPADISTLVIRAQCVEETCSGSEKLLVNDIKIRLSDEEPPSIWIAGSANLAFTAGDLDSGMPWLDSDVLRFWTRATDAGSGVASAAVRLDNDSSPLWSSSGSCADRWTFDALAPPAIVYDRSMPCPGLVDSVRLLDLAGIDEGRHKLRVSAVDEMGNVADPEIRWFGFDETSPAPPEFVKISQTPVNEHGWTNSGFYAAYTSTPPVVGPDEAPVGDAQASITRDDISAAGLATNVNGVTRPFPSEGHFRIDAWFVDAAGNRSTSTPGFVGYDTTPPPAPVLGPNDWVSRQDLIDGYAQTWDPVEAGQSVESGICGFVSAFDQSKEHDLEGPEEIRGNVTSAPVPAGLPEGVNYAHIASVSCAGIVSPTATAELRVDTTAPTVDIDGLPAGLWSDHPVHLTLSPQDASSGVSAVHWRLDEGSEETAGDDGSLVVGEGQHVLTTWADDNAHNISSPETFVINVDQSGPEVWISGGQEGAVNEFTAHAEDPLSGLDSAALQFRRTDAGASTAEQEWRQMGSAYLPEVTTTAERSFTRALNADDLADGRYELRVVAFDRAGNLAAGGQLGGGGYLIDLPLWPRPVQTLAVADMVRRCSGRGCASDTKCRKGSRCSFRWVSTRRGAAIDRIADWGRRQALVGSLLTPSGVPLRGAQVTIYQRVGSAAREVAGRVTTDERGNFELRIAGGASRSFESVAALGGYARSVASAKLTVRAGVELKASDNSVRSHQRIVFSGRIAGDGLGIPLDGRTIQLEYWSDGQWETGLGHDDTDSSGRFRIAWRSPGVTRAGSLIVRAKADSRPSETAWPFATGKSPQVRLKLRP